MTSRNNETASNEQLLDDLRQVWVERGGKGLRGIVAEIRRRGHAKFMQIHLYCAQNGAGFGLIERLGLRDLVPAEPPKPPNRNITFRVWLKRYMPRWTWDWDHQLYLYKELAALRLKQNRRLMIFMPPRHGKSELVTVRYSAWRLERNPKLKIIIGSYNQALANRFSRMIKRIVSERIPLAADHRSVAEWETSEGGGVKAVGVGAGITGFGANLVIIDDPIKSRAEAESTTYRTRVWEWFNDDLHTRLEPNAAMILIQTRWHEDDLAGRLIDQMESGGEKWRQVSLPALAEAGDPLDRREGAALCPERYNRTALLRKQKQLGTYSFSAMYQQRPVPGGGMHFKREWFDGKIVAHVPPDLDWCRGYDLAVSTKTSADYTASFRCAMDKAGNIYIADGFRKRIEYPDQRRYIIERMQSETNTSHGIESALHGSAIVQDLRSDRTLVRHRFKAIKVEADKVTRALAWANRAEEGKVFLVKGRWIDEFLDELCTFPVGKHDDQVDAVSLAIRMLSTKERSMQRFD
ncbi:MAG TPA: phage terminase large subunit [Pyrinomonadaceae bacterium]|nr:phage terminase large subunit [Pyrinomonadaceae bacterium]